MKKTAFTILCIVVSILLFSSCGSGNPSVPKKSMEYFSTVKAIDTDSFDKDSGKWQILAPGGIQDGKLLLIGKEWYSNVYKQPVTDGHGIIIDFTYTGGSIFEILFTNGEWGTDQHKRFGVYIDSNNIRPDTPPINLGNDNITGNFPLKPDTAYSIMMAILPGGEFLTVIWDPSNPKQAVEYHKIAGDKWAGYPWTFSIGGNYGTIRFDNFKSIEVGGMIKAFP